MHGPIWELQEPGQPPLPSQDLIGLFAGTGRAHRPLFPHSPCRWRPAALSWDPRGLAERRESQEIGADRIRPLAASHLFFPHCPCWLFLDMRSGVTCEQLVSQNNYECAHCRTDSWSTCGRIRPLTKAETRQRGEASSHVSALSPGHVGSIRAALTHGGLFMPDAGVVVCSMATAALGTPSLGTPSLETPSLGTLSLGTPSSPCSEQGRGETPSCHSSSQNVPELSRQNC